MSLSLEILRERARLLGDVTPPSKQPRILTGHTESIWSVSFSPGDGCLLASGTGDRTVRLWDVASGREVRRLEGHTAAVWGVHFSPDGRLLASGSSDRTVRLWEVASGREVRRLEGHTSGVWGIHFSADGH